MARVPESLRERWVFVDSSAYLGLLDEDDEHHADATRIVRRLGTARFRQFTTNILIVEAHALVLSTMVTRVASRFLRGIDASNTVVVRARSSDEESAKRIIYEYDDKDFSLADAISFAVMDRLAITQAFTFDRHFAQFGYTVLTA